MEERLNAPPAPCLSCADWFLPAATARDRLDSLTSSSPVLSKIAGAIKGSSSSGTRGRTFFGDKSRKPSPHRSLSDSGTEGQADAGSGARSKVPPGLSPRSTPDSARKLGGRQDSLGSGGSDGDGGSLGLFKVTLIEIWWSLWEMLLQPRTKKTYKLNRARWRLSREFYFYHPKQKKLIIRKPPNP